MNSIIKFLKSGAGFILHPTHKRTMGIVIMFVLAAAVSLTVVLSQQQQTIRQRASESTEKGYVLCGEGLKCQNNITVGGECDGESAEYNKCLSTTKNFGGADRINGKSLTCCNNRQYLLIDSECTLVKKNDPLLDDESISTCQPPEPPIAESYVPCGGPLTCENNITVDTACENGFNKCLSLTGFSGADRINGKSLTCCNAKEYGWVDDACALVADGEFSDPACSIPIVAAAPALDSAHNLPIIDSTASTSTPLGQSGTCGNVVSEENCFAGNSCPEGYSSVNSLHICAIDPSKTMSCCVPSSSAPTTQLPKTNNCTSKGNGAYCGNAGSSCQTGFHDINNNASSNLCPNNFGALLAPCCISDTAPTPTPTSAKASTAESYVLCGSGLKCENNIKVDTPDKEGFNKCLSTKNFYNADKINGKYLTRCNSDLYYFDVNNNNECSLVPGSNPSTEMCTPPNPPENDPNHVSSTPSPTPTLTPTPTAGASTCPIPAAPTNLTCDTTANKIKWDVVSGATYAIRVDDQSNPWKGISCATAQNAGDFCVDNVSGTETEKAFTFGAEKEYKVWVHTVNSCGKWSPNLVEEERLTCFGPIPAGETSAIFNIALSGIADDPKRISRNLKIEIFDPLDNALKAELATDIAYDSSVKQFKGPEVLDEIKTGIYNIKVKSDGYLRKLILSVPITKGIQNNVVLATLTPGDINGDNKVDLLDYNLFVSCYGTKASQPTCDKTFLRIADFDDNIAIDGIDYNTFIRGLSVKEGD